MTTASPALRTSWRRETATSATRAILFAVVGGIIIGGLTSYAQQFLPDAIRSIANSAGGWTAFTFLLVWLGRSRPLLAAILGVVTFEALTEAYTVVSTLRGFPSSFFSIWVFLGIPAGIVIGIAASLVRHATPLWKTLGVAVLFAVLAGEGAYGLLFLLDHTSPVYWTVQLVAGVGMLVAALVVNRLRLPLTALTVGVALVGALLFVGIYRFVL